MYRHWDLVGVKCVGGDKDTQQRQNKQEIIYTTDTYKN